MRGPSPRGRGNHGGGRAPVRRGGSIPAWAGKPRGRGSCSASRRVHPRVGGETWRSVLGDVLKEGPSPRGRGNRS